MSSRNTRTRKRKSSMQRYSKRPRFNPYFSRSLGYPINSNIYRHGYFAVKFIINVATDSSGVLFQEFYTFNPTGYTDITNIGNIYDQYKVTAMKVNWYPNLPNDTSAITGFRPLHTFIDYDNIIGDLTALSTTEPIAISYANHKAFNLYQPFTRFIRMPTISGGAVASNQLNVGSGYVDFAQPPVRGLLYMFANVLDPSTTYGTVVLTMYIKTINQR